ncbi:MAG: glycosyl hydrolase 53 family protein, partial [Lachnospiraceae bacterium]
MEKTVKGVDISTLLELEKLHTKYYDNGICGDLVDILAAHGVDGVRLRLWNSPFDSDGIAYGGGTDDLITVIEIAKRCKAAGMSFFLDLHYSDFWADAGKQTKPKAWKDYSMSKLCDAVKRYTVSVLEYLEAAGVRPDMVQPGNEITNGLLWPEGKFPEYKSALKLIDAAIEGIRSFNNDIKIVLHLSPEPEHPVYTEFMDVFGKEL